MLFSKKRALVLGLTTGIALLSGAACAGSLHTLYSFIGNLNHATDGATPAAAVIEDANGNFFGTASQGGDSDCGGGCGTVFEFSAAKKETTLLIFHGANGMFPTGSLLEDSKGNLYGTTFVGGKHNMGVVFKLSSKGVETVLHSFCSRKKCADGSSPYGALVADKAGNLYGTTSAGGALNLGVVYKIAKDGSETVLYSFKGNSDGATPMAGLSAPVSGTMYGTTSAGGSTSCEGPGCGTVYKITTAGKETVLYKFCVVGSCVNGQEPWAPPIRDAAGNLYGTTRVGGGHGQGTIFKLTPGGTESVLLNFAGAVTGGEPIGGVIADAAGNFYGQTLFGGDSDGNGVVYELEKSGKQKILHTFTGGKDGGQGKAGLFLDSAGTLFGTTQVGGTESSGALFKIAK